MKWRMLTITAPRVFVASGSFIKQSMACLLLSRRLLAAAPFAAAPFAAAPFAAAPFAAALVAASFAGTGCSQKLPAKLVVPEIVLQPDSSRLRNSVRIQGVELFVDSFRDARGSNVFVEAEGKSAEADGDVAGSVESVLKKSLETRGFRLTEMAPVVMSGEVRKWNAIIKGSGLGSEVNSEASVYIEVFDPANKRIYSGVYQGYSSLEQSGVDSEDLGAVLSNSMSEALRQILGDSQMMSLLASF